MNPDPKAVRILCYGDSNTWGRGGSSVDRYLANVRWTGILQSLLGFRFEVIEEGLRSRTTDLDDNDPEFPGRNGLTYLRPCLESHTPLNLVVLWLGTNDLKTKFNRTARDVAQAIDRMIGVIEQVSLQCNNGQTRILLVSPPRVKETVLKPKSQFVGAGLKSEELTGYLEDLAYQKGTYFIDMATYVEPGDADGVHLDPQSHPIVAQVMFEKIKELF